jgi:hypothetical protein
MAENKYVDKITVYSEKEGKDLVIDLKNPECVSKDQRKNTAVAPSNWW